MDSGETANIDSIKMDNSLLSLDRVRRLVTAYLD